MLRHCAGHRITEEECMNLLRYFSDDPASQIVLQSCIEHAITPEELLSHAQVEFEF
jgi:hypothetical protein